MFKKGVRPDEGGDEGKRVEAKCATVLTPPLHPSVRVHFVLSFFFYCVTVQNKEEGAYRAGQEGRWWSSWCRGGEGEIGVRKDGREGGVCS